MGAMLAAFVLVGMYWQQISTITEFLEAAHAPVVSATGPAGILASYPLESQNNMGFLFL